jgi:hypothetical protein
MIDIHNAIRALNPSVVTIRGDIAYDANEQEIAYDKSAVEAKLAELQAAEAQAQQAVETHKANAISKLSSLGLTQDEINALIG